MHTSNSNRLTLLIVLFVLALAALILHQTGQLEPFEDLALGWLEPVLGGVVGTRDSAATVAGSFVDVSAMRTRLAQLQAQVDAMTLDNVRLNELINENKILRDQLGYKQANSDYDLLGATVLDRNPDLARVVGSDPSSLVHSVVVDQGSAQGVKPGMPVITPQGLVGRVTATGAQWSKVLLILDPSSSVNAVVQSTRATGIVQGDISGNLMNPALLIKYVPQGEAIKTGDKILTSGLGANFPKRIVIGQVTDVRKHDNDLFQEATVLPSVDFTRLEFVLIVKQFTPSDITTEPTPTPAPSPKPTSTPKPTTTPAR
jgi:rod shape-determining protein MreC